MADRTEYGKEDHVFAMQLKRVVTLQRACTPELWHLYHAKAGWGGTADGMATEKARAAKVCVCACALASTRWLTRVCRACRGSGGGGSAPRFARQCECREAGDRWRRA
jgi:hypothetical protein